MQEEALLDVCNVVNTSLMISSLTNAQGGHHIHQLAGWCVKRVKQIIENTSIFTREQDFHENERSEGFHLRQVEIY